MAMLDLMPIYYTAAGAGVLGVTAYRRPEKFSLQLLTGAYVIATLQGAFKETIHLAEIHLNLDEQTKAMFAIWLVAAGLYTTALFLAASVHTMAPYISVSAIREKLGQFMLPLLAFAAINPEVFASKVDDAMSIIAAGSITMTMATRAKSLNSRAVYAIVFFGSALTVAQCTWEMFSHLVLFKNLLSFSSAALAVSVAATEWEPDADFPVGAKA